MTASKNPDFMLHKDTVFSIGDLPIIFDFGRPRDEILREVEEKLGRGVIYEWISSALTVRDEGVKTPLALAGIVIPLQRTPEGLLLKTNAEVWKELIRILGTNWARAFEIPAAKWEEIIAGAFDSAGFEEVTLTPRSGDRGRDVIAIKRGVCGIKIIGSVKANKPGNLVSYDDVRALLGVISGERDTSKGIITTTSDFPPHIKSDPFIAPFLPTRLDLLNGQQLQKWLLQLATSKGDAPRSSCSGSRAAVSNKKIEKQS